MSEKLYSVRDPEAIRGRLEFWSKRAFACDHEPGVCVLKARERLKSYERLLDGDETAYPK
jgi:hypothetical protein